MADDNRVDSGQLVDSPVLVAVHDGGKDIVRVGAGADEEEDDQQQRLEVEKCGLRCALAHVMW